MKPRTVFRPPAPQLLAASAALLLALSACGSASDGSATKKGDGNTDDPASLVPEEVVQRGYITVGADASYPPIGFIGDDGTTIEGLDSDLAEAMGEILDIEFREQNSSFDAIIPGLQGEKFDIGMSWMNDTPERREVVDFVNYSEDGTSILIPADSKKKPESLDAMCGMRIAVQKGTAQQTDATAQSDTCKSAGEEKITVQTYPDQTAANLALDSGRADLTLADTPIVAWQEKQTHGKLEVVGEPYGKVHHGVAVPKDSELTLAIGAAMQELVDNGDYQDILDKWDMGIAAIDEVLINDDPIK